MVSPKKSFHAQANDDRMIEPTGRVRLGAVAELDFANILSPEKA
jgi:hypothetical protein